jgi:ferritin-like metal-binding protein YciE
MTFAQSPLHALLIRAMKDMLYAENAVRQELFHYERLSSNSALQELLVSHGRTAERQIQSLKACFAELDLPAESVACPAIDGMIREGRDMLREFENSAAIDSVIIFMQRALQHYEFARYSSMIGWCQLLELNTIGLRLSKILNQEVSLDIRLLELATEGIDDMATELSEEAGGLAG